MTISTPNTTLEHLRRAVSFSPWHYWQLANSDLAPITNACPTLVHQYAWQGKGQAGRSELWAALLEAEQALQRELGYPVGPQWLEDTIPYTRGPIRLSNGAVLDLGAKVETLIGTTVPTYSDPNGDGLNETFTATLATTVTNASQIVVRVPLAEQPTEQRENQDRWTIAPLDVTISGGTATIIGSAWLLVRPLLYEQAGAQAIDPTVAGNFLTVLDVYQVTTDSAQAVSYTRNGTALTGTVAWSIVNSRQGIIRRVGGCDAVDTLDCQRPTHMTIRYRAGAPLAEWQQIVSRFALANVAQGICTCEDANRAASYWQYDMSTNQANATLFQMRVEALNNPFGTRRGHIQAWSAVEDRRLSRGISSLA